ncbi:MAG: hypothetical protein JSS35_06835 [Proteobacteria bacterium]|nr:hypothetical protein [Pseudomonadota bacterium]
MLEGLPVLLTALTSVVLYFAQAAPESAPAPAAPVISRVVTPGDGASAPLSVTASVKPREVSPLVVTPEAKPNTEVTKNTVVCRTEPVLGSLFPKKICATREAREERRNLDQEQLREWTALRPYKSN